MLAANGRGRQRRRRLRTEDNKDNDDSERSGCSGQREQHEPQLDESPVPTSNDEAAPPPQPTAMTNERRAPRSRRSRRTKPTFLLSLSSLPLSLSWRHMYYAVFTICWMANGASAAPTDRHERQPTLEILDGYVNYSIGNGSSTNPNFHDISKNAFLSLQGTPVEARFRLGTAYQLESSEKEHSIHVNHVEHQAHVDHLTRHHRKKNRKPVGKLKKIETDVHGETVLDGRKHALLQLADPDALNMNQRCDGQKFKQRIRVDGCLTKVVVNRLCHGTCASIFIPRMHSKKLKAAFRSCAACAPAEYDFVDITLDCPGRNPPTATKTIVKVKSCKCREVRISPL
ncbi:unnamed protein product [Caenorhabditis sp. 36 PRJEB53466]|nr:unnamed protein product [Caenorhabditis sp. 36 PRJEB53466]